VQPVGRGAIDYLPVRTVFADADSLSSAAMQRLLVELAEKYDRILLVGEPLDARPFEAETLAGYADGMVLIVHRDDEAPAACRRAVEASRAAGVPWIGACVRSTRNGETDRLPFCPGPPGPVDGRTGARAPADELPEEIPSIPNVPRSQPAGFGGDAPGPFEPQSLDPPRRASHPTDQHVEGRANLKANRRS
jgi:hypothetical protein